MTREELITHIIELAKPFTARGSDPLEAVVQILVLHGEQKGAVLQLRGNGETEMNDEANQHKVVSINANRNSWLPPGHHDVIGIAPDTLCICYWKNPDKEHTPATNPALTVFSKGSFLDLYDCINSGTITALDYPDLCLPLRDSPTFYEFEEEMREKLANG